MSWIRRSFDAKKAQPKPIVYEIEEENDETDSNFSDEMVGSGFLETYIEFAVGLGITVSHLSQKLL